MAIKHIGANSRGSDMSESQNDKYLKHNDHVDLLADRFLGEVVLDIGFSADPNYVLSAEAWTENFSYRLRSDTSPSIDSDFTLILPATKGQALFRNDTGFKATIEGGASPTGTTVDVNDGAKIQIYSDGENVVEIKSDVYDLAALAPGNVSLHYDQTIFGMVAIRPFKIATDLAGSLAKALAGPDSGETDKVYSLEKNASEFATVTFSDVDANGVFSSAAAQSFAIGDTLTIVGPPDVSPDVEASSLADVMITIKGVV